MRMLMRTYKSLKPMMKIRWGIVLVTGVWKESFHKMAKGDLWRRWQ